MKQDTDYKKRELLIMAAKEEFLEKGYNKASLRSICSKAGVTTGALYFFFENKADLFSAIVDGPIEEIKGLIVEHFRDDMAYLSTLKSKDDIDMEHEEVSNRLVECIYRNYDSVMLLLTGAENTVYENIVDDFVALMAKMVPPMISSMQGYECDEFMSHWMSHMTIDAYIHVIVHVKEEEEAKRKLKDITNYIVRGWVELAMVKK
ncbi:MAG: TetR/AcrR family transcriptional regulator [Lachnospiraceae bacterium]|nr:TetR/AcrR family transcriptional regulator [Lachnospiraceae bacterium]